MEAEMARRPSVSNLERETYHDCQPPNVTDRASKHRWRCDICRTRWNFHPRIYPASKRRVASSFLGLGSRVEVVPATDRGRWTPDPREPWWVPVEETP
jgi:hypothetical protein